MTKNKCASDVSVRQRQTQTASQPVELERMQSADTRNSTTQNKNNQQHRKQQQQQQQKRQSEDVKEKSSVDGDSSIIFIILQMVFCVVGIYACFGMWSIKQERVITKPYHSRLIVSGKEVISENKLSTVFVIGLVQALAGVFAGSVLLFMENYFSHSARVGSFKRFSVFPAIRLSSLRLPALMGFTNSFGASLGYAAMRRLPYPVVLAAKMSKMIPVMIVGFFWHGTRYSLSKCLACAVITGGIMCFYLLEEKHHPHAEATPKAHAAAPAATGWIGFVLLFFNLIADGFTNSTQDVLVKNRGWSGNRLMFWTNFSSAVWLTAALLLLEALHPLASGFLAAEKYAEALGPAFLHPLLIPLEEAARWALQNVLPLQDLSRTWDFFRQHPDALSDVLVLSALNAVGQFFIFRTISLFGTLTLAAMTLLRKAGSVVLSITVHGHHVATGQWVSLLIVFGGALCEAVIHVRGKSRGTHARIASSVVDEKKEKKKGASRQGQIAVQ